MAALNANRSRRYNNRPNPNNNDAEELRQYRKKQQANTSPLLGRKKKKRTEKTKPTKQVYSDVLEAWERYSLRLL